MRVVMLGMPEAGKSTFLGALWHSANRAVPEEAALTVRAVGPDSEYLNKMSHAWLNGETFDRTDMNETRPNTMTLRADGQDNEVMIPDFSGELSKKAYREAQWPPQLADAVAEADGVLLFVHLEDLTSPSLIAWVEEVSGETSQEDPIPQEPWDPDDAPTVVKLVGLLELVAASQEKKNRPIRVALIISAWDLVNPATDDPAGWFSERGALLAQFLRNNTDKFEHTIYGISAQGGVLSGATRKRLLGYKKPSNRIRVVVQGAESHDITAPLKWVLSI